MADALRDVIERMRYQLADEENFVLLPPEMRLILNELMHLERERDEAQESLGAFFESIHQSYHPPPVDGPCEFCFPEVKSAVGRPTCTVAPGCKNATPDGACCEADDG